MHNKNFGYNQKELLNKIAAQNPDIVVVTGDLIDAYKTDFGTASKFIVGVQALAPVYFVPGNHEALAKSDYNVLETIMQEAGVTILENQAVKIKREEATVTIVGLIDPAFANGAYLEDEKTMANYLAELEWDKNDYVIGLAHRPELDGVYQGAGLDLVLCGHAHGGQFITPFLGPLYAPDQGWFPTKTQGIHKQGDTTMIVSRGLGNSVVPVRFNNRPELVVVKLENQ